MGIFGDGRIFVVLPVDDQMFFYLFSLAFSSVESAEMSSSPVAIIPAAPTLL